MFQFRLRHFVTSTITWAFFRVITELTVAYLLPGVLLIAEGILYMAKPFQFTTEALYVAPESGGQPPPTTATPGGKKGKKEEKATTNEAPGDGIQDPTTSVVSPS